MQKRYWPRWAAGHVMAFRRRRFGAREIARALLAEATAIHQRLVRSKRRIRLAPSWEGTNWRRIVELCDALTKHSIPR